MLNIVMPMAGHGSRFKKAGYTIPKPLIPVHGVSMTKLVINNLRPKTDHRFIFLVLKEHVDNYEIDKKLQDWAPGCKIIIVEEVTQGAACTVLLAKKYINNQDQLMIANCDQWVDIDINSYLAAIKDYDGLIMTMWADHPKWSYVGFDEKGEVNEVIEKKVISNEATVGVYNYKIGEDFVKAAETMIKKNIRVNNEFYVAPVYNEMLNEGKKLWIYNIGKVLRGMYGLGTPQDLDVFTELEISKRAVKF